MVAKMADSGDTGVREGALTFIGEIYKILDESIWRLMGPVSIKVKGLLEERFKRVKKGGDLMNRSINVATPQPERKTLTASSSNMLNRSIVKSGGTPSKLDGMTKKESSGNKSLTQSITKQMTTSINNNISNNGGVAQP